MKTVGTSEINLNNNFVATYNADPFFVEHEDMLQEVLAAAGDYVEEYTSEDEEYNDLVAKLDGNSETFAHVYAANDVIFGILK